MNSPSASTGRESWVGLGCDVCGARYGCRIDALGKTGDNRRRSTGRSPQLMALQDLDVRLQEKAKRLPCPQCGSYRQSHVDRVRNLSGRCLVWALFIAISGAIVALLARFAPATPWWVLGPTGIATWVGSGALGNFLAQQINPNRNLENNRNNVRGLVDRGVLRVHASTAEEP